MEKGKRWEEYTKDEQSKLLNHWYIYYGGLVVTFAEIEQFHELVPNHLDDIFDFIVTSFVANDTIQSNFLTICMRNNKLDDLFAHVVKCNQLTQKELEDIIPIRQFILDEIVDTYNNPN